MAAYITPDQLEQIAARYGKGKERRIPGGGWITLCPCHDDQNPSLALTIGRKLKLVLQCHAGCHWKEVKSRIEGDFPALQGKIIREKREGLPAYIYSQSKTLTDQDFLYFTDIRGISFTGPQRKALEAVSRVNRYKGKVSIVSPMTRRPGGVLRAIHQVFLEGGRKAGEKYQGRKKGNAVWIGGVQDQLAIGEGLETCLSVFTAINIPVAVAGDAGNLPQLTLPERVRQVFILTDCDLKEKDRRGQQAAIEAARAYQQDGRTVYLVSPSADTFDKPRKKRDFNNLSSDEILERWKARETLEDVLGRFKPDRDEGPTMDDSEDDALDIPEWPKLSQDALPGIVGEFVDLATRDSEADPAAVLATLLVRCAAEIGYNPYYCIGESKQRLLLGSVLVGTSSKARKGLSAGPIKSLFKKIQKVDSTWISAKTSSGPLSSGEGLIYAVRDEVKEWQKPTKTKPGRFVVKDPGVTDKRLFVLDEEFAGVLAKTKTEGNILSMVIRKFWDSGNAEPLTKHNRIRCTGAHVCWISHITNAELRAKLEETEALNGFGNRILWVCVRRHKHVSRPQPIPDEAMKRMAAAFVEVIRKAQGLERVRMTQNAGEFYDKLYMKITPSRPGLYGVITGRAEAQVIRLSLLYAMLEGCSRIHTRHIKSGLAFWNYADASARFIFHGMNEDPKKRKLLDALKVQGEMSRTHIRDLFGRHLKKERLESMLSQLIAQGHIVKEIEKTGGRPRDVFKMSPATKAIKATKATKGKDEHLLKSLKSHKSQGPKKNNEDDGYWNSLLKEVPPPEEDYTEELF